MGFFSKLFDFGCPGDEERAIYNSEIENLKQSIPAGFVFMYMGTECVVVDNKKMIPTYPSPTNVPSLEYEYRDKEGLVHRGNFGYEQALKIVPNAELRGAEGVRVEVTVRHGGGNEACTTQQHRRRRSNTGRAGLSMHRCVDSRPCRRRWHGR